MKKAFQILCLASMLTLTVSPVRAEETQPEVREPSKEDKTKAKRFFAQGRRLFRRRRFSQAVEAFQKAYSYWNRREILFNIAFAYARLGENVKAVEHLREYLKAATDAEKRKIPPVLRKMQQSVGVLIIQVPGEEAKIFVDGREAGSGRVEIVVETGKRVVEIRHKGKTVARNEMDAEPGMEKIWELTELPGTEPKPEPMPDPRPDPRHDPKPEPDPIPPPKTPQKKGLHWAYFAAATGLAAVAAGVAVGTGLKTDSLREEYEEEPTKATMDKGNRMRFITNAIWGVSAGFAVGAAVVAVFTQWKSPKEKIDKDKRSVTILPTFSKDGGLINISFSL